MVDRADTMFLTLTEDRPGAESGEEKAARSVFTFVLAGEEYGVELASVKEIVKFKDLKVTAVPSAPPFILGLLSLRGEIVPLLDLRQRLGLEDVPTPPPSGGATTEGLSPEQEREARMASRNFAQGATRRIVICEYRDSPFGIVVDGVGGVVHVAEDRLEAPPAHIVASQAEYIEKLGKYDARERRRVSDFIPGGEEAPSELGGPRPALTPEAERIETSPPASGDRLVAILHLPKVVDFGWGDEDGG